MATDVIILNRMYVGDYLGENLGHEVINLIKDDNGNNYIYINHDGNICDEIINKTWKPKTILLTQWCTREYEENDEINNKENKKAKTQSLIEILAKINMNKAKYWEDTKIKKKYKDRILNIKIDEQDDNSKYIKDIIKKENLKTFKDVRECFTNKAKSNHLTKKAISKTIFKLQRFYIEQEDIKFNNIPINKIFEKFYHKNSYLYLTFSVPSKDILKIKVGYHLYLVDKISENLKTEIENEPKTKVIDVHSERFKVPETDYEEKDTGDYIKLDNSEYQHVKRYVKNEREEYKENRKGNFIRDNNKKGYIEYNNKFYAIKTQYKINFSKQSLKQYIVKGINGEKNHKKVYKNIDVIESDAYKDFWDQPENSTKKYEELFVHEKEYDYPEKSNNFISLIRQDYDELTYSNLFFYIFKSCPKLFRDFAIEKLKIKEIDISQDIKVVREEGNIDLLIVDQKKETLIVIENKIKSGINGLRHDINDKIVGNQLCKYMYYTHGYKVDKVKDKKENKYEFKEFSDKEREIKNYSEYKHRYFYIFAPEYKNFGEKVNIEKFLGDEANAWKEKEYTVISYKNIYEFFSKYEFNEDNIKPKYYEEFLFALRRHKNNVDNIKEQQMFERFAERIEELNNSMS